MADVEDELASCPVCFEDYEVDGEHVPRIFPCHHTMCERCVGRNLKQLGSGYRIFCHICRKQHRADNGVKTFCQNEYILSHIRKENARKIEIMNEKEKAKQAEMSKELCSVHNREAHLYCLEKTCEKPICFLCLKPEHKDHDFEDLNDIKKQKHDQLMATLDDMKEYWRQWQKCLRVKDEDVKKTFDSFETRLTIEKEKRIRMVDLMYEHFREQAYNQLMRDISTDINCDVENAEAKMKIVDDMKTKDFSQMKDITGQLDAANKLKEDEKYNRRHQERCTKIEDVKRTLDAVTLKDASSALPIPNLKYTGEVK